VNAPAAGPRGPWARLLFALGSLLATLAWSLRIRRRVALENLALAFPALPAAERLRIARACYSALGRTLAEVAWVRGEDDEALARWVTFEGTGPVRAALAQGRGLVCAIGHFGNWELLGRAAARAGFRLTAITRALRGRFNRWLLAARREGGLAELGERGVSRAALEVLRRGEVLAVVVDQNMRPRRGLFVDFFGRPACTTPAAAVYALRAGAPLFAAFPVRQADGSHRVEVTGPFAPAPGLTGHAAVLDLTARLTAEVERQVRAHPEQWFWLHRRWKTRPGDPR
jgi:KDO2-lipid IV(A) lauroyltransferase